MPTLGGNFKIKIQQMKNLIKALKIFAIVLISLIIVLVITLTIYNQIGNSSIKAQIDGLGTRIFFLSYQSVSGKTESYKVALCLNDKISIKASIKELSGAKLHFINNKNSGSRADQIRFFLEPNDEVIIRYMLSPGVLNSTFLCPTLWTNTLLFR